MGELVNSNIFLTVKYLFHFVTRAFLIAILIIMLLFSLLVIVYFGDLLINVNNSQYKNPLFGAYVIVSPSMVPTIMINDAIVIKRVDNDNYNIGDIITYASNDINYNGMLITHRIVDKAGIKGKNSIYTTKGDNNRTVDSVPVSTSDIYGRVILKIPKVGYMKEFFSKPINYFICLIVPALVFIIYDFSRMFIIMITRKKAS